MAAVHCWREWQRILNVGLMGWQKNSDTYKRSALSICFVLHLPKYHLGTIFNFVV